MGESPPWLDYLSTSFNPAPRIPTPIEQLTVDLLGNHPKPYCIEVGCKRGDWIAFVRRFQPRAEVIGFEPCPQVFEELIKGFPDPSGILLLPYAIGSSPGVRSYTLQNIDDPRDPRFMTDLFIQVSQVTLEPYIRKRVDLLKISSGSTAILYSLHEQFGRIDSILFDLCVSDLGPTALRLLEYMSIKYPYLAYLDSEGHLKELGSKEEQEKFINTSLETNTRITLLATQNLQSIESCPS